MIDVSTLTLAELDELLAEVNKERVKRDEENRIHLMNNIKKAVSEFVGRYGEITVSTEDGCYFLNASTIFDGKHKEITIE